MLLNDQVVVIGGHNTKLCPICKQDLQPWQEHILKHCQSTILIANKNPIVKRLMQTNWDDIKRTIHNQASNTETASGIEETVKLWIAEKEEQEKS